MDAPIATVVCREIKTSDIERITDLLAQGFPRDSRIVWARRLRRLGEHCGPPQYPKFGYMLEVNGDAVGVLLLIFSTVKVSTQTHVRCSVSSWYVRPEARCYANILVSRALKSKDVTYLNITPAAHTHPILLAQGYRPFAEGAFLALLGLGRGPAGVTTTIATDDLAPGPDLSADEIKLLLDHKALGCLSILCTLNGRRTPFIFWRRVHKSKIAYAALVYCRSHDDVVHFAGPIGRFLLQRSLAFTMMDANGPVPGLIGTYLPKRPRYYKGPNPPRLGDLTYTEVVTLGL